MIEVSSKRIYFDGVESASLGLMAVFADARKTDNAYTFGPLSVDAVLSAGLTITGDTSVVDSLAKIPGVSVSDT